MKHLVILIIPLLLFCGCSMTPMTITEDMFNEAGDVIGQTSTTIADASVAKEKIFHVTLREDLEGYYKSLAASGSKTEITGWEEKVNDVGVKYLMPKIVMTYTEAPKRSTNLPTAPSIHPVWSAVEKGEDLLFKGFLSWLTFGVLSDAVNKDTTSYQGDYASGSYNPTTTNPYVIQ